MAGFFIVLGDIKEDGKKIKDAKDVLVDLCKKGLYSTNQYIQNDLLTWSKNKVSTFADYFSMQEDDYVFFFAKRKIYGVGRLVNVGVDCKYWAFEGANIPKVYSEEEIVESKLADGITPDNRCVCFFEPIEYYPHAIDMDDALTAFPESFRSLRVIQDRTFIKLDEEEARALFSVLHKRNAEYDGVDRVDWTPPLFDESTHSFAKERIVEAPEKYSFTIESLLKTFPLCDNHAIGLEMAVEAAVVNSLTKGLDSDVFDRMYYVTHQVSASPAKPVEYMEWMDVFSYSTFDYLLDNGFPVQLSVDKYYVIEIKKDPVVLPKPQYGKDVKAAANQLMKYVDWVAKYYARGNYPMVKGILISNKFDQSFFDYCKKVCVRNYNDGYRDSKPEVWRDFELIEYSFDGGNISFKKVYSGTENY